MLRRLFLVPLLALLLLVDTGPSHAVVGGGPAPDGAYPWMTALVEGDFQFCGASLIAPGWVLTAAHCVEGAKPDKLQVVISRENLTNEADGERIQVAEIRVHPSYDKDGNLEYDSALLRLARNSVATPITLSGSGDDDLERDGAPVKVAGWGDRYGLLGVASTNQLQHADLSVVGDDPCREDYHAASQVCAEGFLKDSCQGDSGGPLFATRNGGTSWIQVGVVSYGLGCAVPEFPGVYAEVNSPLLRGWISTNAGV